MASSYITRPFNAILMAQRQLLRTNKITWDQLMTQGSITFPKKECRYTLALKEIKPINTALFMKLQYTRTHVRALRLRGHEQQHRVPDPDSVESGRDGTV